MRAKGFDRFDRHVLSPGQTLASKYRVIRVIGRGGMGEVYDAEDLTLRTHVALKTVRTEMARAQLVERLKRELYLARRVTHPNVCRLFDVGIHRGRAGESVARRWSLVRSCSRSHGWRSRQVVRSRPIMPAVPA